MLWEDLDVALRCFIVGDKDITVQTAFQSDLPYIRRYIARKLGSPDGCMGNWFKYGKKRIFFNNIIDESDANDVDPNTVFYVGRDSGEDLIDLAEKGFDTTDNSAWYEIMEYKTLILPCR
jgi:hypothetical protein